MGQPVKRKRVDLPYLSIELDRHGNERHYVRRGGKRTRVRGVPGSPAYLDAYKDAIEAKAAPEAVRAKEATKRIPGSLGWLCQQYYGSAEYKTLGPSTRRVRQQILERICEKDGDKRYRMLEARHIRADRDKMTDRPEAANSHIKALRQMFKWACDPTVELATQNPAEKVPYLDSKNPAGFHTWTTEEVAQFEAKYPIGTKSRLALALLLYTGVRRSDVIRLGPQMVKDGWLKFTEVKGHEKIVKDHELPILPTLHHIISKTPTGHLNFLVTEHGKAYSHGGFGNWFSRQCRLAGLVNCSAHGLRKAGATIAAENGATEFQLMAIYGWVSAKQAAIYTRKVNRKKLAGEGMRFISRAEQDENEIVSPESAVAESETEIGKKDND